MKDLPTSSEMLEELAAKVETEIDQLSISSFRSALFEMTDFHKFLIAAYLTEDDKQQSFSFSEIGYWRSLHEEWLSEYRNLFERAVAQISKEEDTAKDFIVSLTNAIFRLLPARNEKFAPKVTAALFNMHLTLIHRLEDWAVRNDLTNIETENIQRGGTAKNLQKRYEDVVRTLIGTSEDLLRTIPSLHGWDDSDEDEQTNQERIWEYYQSSWPLMSQHIRNTAYFLVVSVWNEDKISAPYYCEALIKWLGPINYKLKEDYILRHEFLTPDLLGSDWNQVLEKIKPYLKHPEWSEHPQPEGIFSAILKNTLKDTINIVSAVILGWFLDSNEEAGLIPVITHKLIYGAFWENSAGTEPVNSYGFFVSLMRILLSGDKFSDIGYAGTLDGFIRLFDGMTEKPQISGRIFTPSTRSRRDELFLPWVVIFFSILPEENVDPQIEKFLSLLEHEELFPDADNSIRSFVHDLKEMQQIIQGTNRERIFLRSYNALGAAFTDHEDLERALENLEKVLGDLLKGIEEQRKKRIQQRPIDPERLKELEEATNSKAFNKDTGAFPLHLFDAIEFVPEVLEKFTHSHREHDRGSLTFPLMDHPVSNEESWWSDTVRNGVSSVVLRDVLRVAETQEVTVLSGKQYWDEIKKFTLENPNRYILIIAGGVEPAWIHDWQWPHGAREREPLPDDLKIWQEEYHKDESRYQFHMNRIGVYQAPIGGNHSFLLPEDIFKKIEFTTFPNGKNTKVEIEEIDDDPWHVVLKVVWARRVTIGDQKILELKHQAPPLE